MKTFTKSALCAAYKYSGVVQFQEAVQLRTGQTQMAILIFHRVTDEIPPDGITVSTKRFRRICQMLKQSFQVVPLAEIFRILRSGEPFPLRTLAITFDDSYRDNLEAARVLKEHQLPASFFIPTGMVETDKVYEWDRDLEVRLANLSWDDVQEMADMGFDIGSHTVNHPNMAAVSEAEYLFELRESKKILEDRLQRPVQWFAFPFGGHEHIPFARLSQVREMGYEGCVSAYSGFITPGMDDAILPREAVPYFDSVINLELYLRGCLHWMYSLKRKISSIAAGV